MATSAFLNPLLGGGSSQGKSALDEWINAVVKEAQRRNKLDPVVQDFKSFIESNPAVKISLNQMFGRVSQRPPYINNLTKKPPIHDYMTMLQAFDVLITQAPRYEKNATINFPIDTFLGWLMGTQGEFASFFTPAVNQHFKAMFDKWAQFLKSPESRSVLTTDVGGWFSPQAMDDMPDFVETYVCDPSAPYYGFQSWDDFFTRQFRPEVRPFEFPENHFIINSGCESTVYNIAHNIQDSDIFWNKGRSYSLIDMLNDDPLAPQFMGGTVYQAFLDANSHHHWHSPIDGTIAKVTEIPGSYYSTLPATGFPRLDSVIPDRAPAFMTSVPARQLIYINADNPAIGLVCFMAMGMAEVSSCEVTVKDGQRVNKGDEIGMFHFGGSTHALLFRPETKITFDSTYPVGAPVPLGKPIALVAS